MWMGDAVECVRDLDVVVDVVPRLRLSAYS